MINRKSRFLGIGSSSFWKERSLMQRVDVVYALIHDEETDKILMVHNVEQNVWSLPGGAVEKVKY